MQLTGAGPAIHPGLLAVGHRPQAGHLVLSRHTGRHGLRIQLAHQLRVLENGLEGLVAGVDACKQMR